VNVPCVSFYEFEKVMFGMHKNQEISDKFNEYKFHNAVCTVYVYQVTVYKLLRHYATTVVLLYPQAIRSKTYRGYAKPRKLPNAIQ
jgi:hypothetical protein